MGHAQFGSGTHPVGEDPHGLGFDPAAQSRHASMAVAFADC